MGVLKKQRVALLFLFLITLLFSNRVFTNLKTLFSVTALYEDSPPIRETTELSKLENFSTFSLSEKLRGDPWVFQQVLYQLWPAKFDLSSKLVFFHTSESVGGCTLIQKKNEVALAKCE